MSNTNDVDTDPGSAQSSPSLPEQAAPEAVNQRLHEVLADLTFADIARATGCNSETVRRYMRGGKLSVAFVTGVAVGFGVSLNWLLLGEGPRHVREGAEPPGASNARQQEPLRVHRPDVEIAKAGSPQVRPDAANHALRATRRQDSFCTGS